MGSYATLVDEMTEVAPLAVDLVPWLTTDHSDMVSRVVRQCHSVTVLAYRDSAAAILAQSDGMLRLCETAEDSLPHRRRNPEAHLGDTGEHDVRR